MAGEARCQVVADSVVHLSGEEPLVSVLARVEIDPVCWKDCVVESLRGRGQAAPVSAVGVVVGCVKLPAELRALGTRSQIGGCRVLLCGAEPQPAPVEFQLRLLVVRPLGFGFGRGLIQTLLLLKEIHNLGLRGPHHGSPCTILHILW